MFCIGSLLSAINIIATVIDMRAPGMALMQMPVTCWNWFITAILSLLSFSVLLPAGILLLLDRVAGTSFFVPEDLRSATRSSRAAVDLRCCGSTSSGSSDIRKSTWRSCPASARSP